MLHVSCRRLLLSVGFILEPLHVDSLSATDLFFRLSLGSLLPRSASSLEDLLTIYNIRGTKDLQVIVKPEPRSINSKQRGTNFFHAAS